MMNFIFQKERIGMIFLNLLPENKDEFDNEYCDWLRFIWFGKYKY